MGPKITSLAENKSQGISRTATVKPIRRVLAKMTISIPSLIQMTSLLSLAACVVLTFLVASY